MYIIIYKHKSMKKDKHFDWENYSILNGWEKS